MNEKSYKKKIEFQQKIISRQLEHIEELKVQNEKLNMRLKEKDEIINSITLLRNELIKNISDVKKYKAKYKELIDELRKMKEILNREVYKNKWKLIKFLLK